MNWRRLLAIMVKEMRQMRRDRITLAMIIGIPVMQLVLFGYAINLNLRGLSAGIADQAGTSASRAVVMDMLATDVIRPTVETATPQELMDLLRRGEISVGVVIPPDFDRQLQQGNASEIQVLIDGTDANTAGLANGYMSQIVQQFSRQLQTNPRPLLVVPEVVFLYNAGLNSTWFFVPGVTPSWRRSIRAVRSPGMLFWPGPGWILEMA